MAKKMDNRRFANFLLLVVVPLVLLVCVGSVGLVIGLNFYYGPVEEELKARLEEIRAQGYPTNRKELAKYIGEPTEQEQRAAAILIEANSKVVRDDSFFYLAYTDREDWELEKIEAIVDKNEEALILIRKAIKTGPYRFPVEVGTFFEMLDQHQQGVALSALKSIVKAQWWAALKRHDADKAVDAFIMRLYLRHTDEVKQPGVHSILVNLTTSSTFMDTIKLYADFDLPKSDLTRVARTLGLLTTEWSLKRELAVHRCMDLIFYQDQHDEEPFDGFHEYVREYSPFGDPNLKRIMAAELRILDLYEPYFEVLESLPLKPGELSEIALPEIEDDDTLVRGVVLSRFFFVSMINQLAVSRLVRCATAIELYTAEHGHIPKSLEVVSPEFIETVPIDPFDGNRIRYRSNGTRYILYSVGRDQQDDNGKIDGILMPDIVFIAGKETNEAQ